MEILKIILTIIDWWLTAWIIYLAIRMWYILRNTKKNYIESIKLLDQSWEDRLKAIECLKEAEETLIRHKWLLELEEKRVFDNFDLWKKPFKK